MNYHTCEEMKKVYTAGINIFKDGDKWIMESDTNEGYTDVTTIEYCPFCGKKLE